MINDFELDADNGYNSSISYSLLKDSDGLDTFSIHPITGVIRTKVVLDHEEKTMYRIGVVASDGGSPSKQSVRMLRIEVLDLNDNRPTFTSSSLAFTVREDAKIGQVSVVSKNLFHCYYTFCVLIDCWKCCLTFTGR